jgi:hypothetical protein
MAACAIHYLPFALDTLHHQAHEADRGRLWFALAGRVN